jgi:translation initiation factor 3 subunit B
MLIITFQTENGYHIYDFRGEQLLEDHVDKFKQFSWRPRPASLLSKEEQKTIRKNLREYSRVFELEDTERINSADVAVVEHRRRVLDEWHAWRSAIEEEVAEERADLGMPPDPVTELLAAYTARVAPNQEEKVVEETVEEVLEESEEILS